MSTPRDHLTDDDKRQIVMRFRDLQHGIANQSVHLPARYAAFANVYRGDSRAFVDAFAMYRTSADRDPWVTQLHAYLYEEIDSRFWRAS